MSKEVVQKRITYKAKAGAEDLEKGIFEGYGSVYENVDDGGDVIHQEAFAEQLATTGLERIKILALHNDSWLPIGKPLELYEDENGLFLKAKISETSLGHDVITLLKDGVLDELSIGFEIIEDEIDSQGIRHIYKANLFEISVVHWAMNPEAKVTEVKKRQVGFFHSQKRNMKRFRKPVQKSKISKLMRGAKNYG